MSIWRNQPLEHIIVTKPFTTLEKKKRFYIKPIVKLPEPSSYLNNDTTFWDSLDEECYQNLQNAME